MANGELVLCVAVLVNGLAKRIVQCGGSGKWFGKKNCPNCKGTGQVIETKSSQPITKLD